MKILRFILACSVLVLSSASCSAQTQPPGWEQQLGKKSSVVGIAQNAKLGPMVLMGPGPLYLQGQSEFKTELLGKTIRVTGILKKCSLPVATQRDGAWSAGVSGSDAAYCLEEAKWEREEK